MNINQLYGDICGLAPVKPSNKDSEYRSVLIKSLKQYEELLGSMKTAGIIIDDDLREVVRTCTKLKDIVKSEYLGLHSTAFTQFSNLLRGNGYQRALGSSIRYVTLKANEKPLYRMRIIENRRDLKCTDMFHIPINKRGVVNTNRYSAPGYPCLYLGSSIYACWEELGRPSMSQSMVSRLSNGKDLYLIDLRVPTLEQFTKSYISYIRAFPLIIACMVRVKDVDASYKPEYCVPQLMMEYVINNNVKHKTNVPISGIYYTSVFKNDDFGYPIDKLENIAIPIQRPLSSKKYCKKLCEIFTITRPTCDEIEQARTGGYDTMEYDPTESSYIARQGVVGAYEYSSFGYLEKRLNDNDLFPLQSIKDE